MPLAQAGERVAFLSDSNLCRPCPRLLGVEPGLLCQPGSLQQRLLSFGAGDEAL